MRYQPRIATAATPPKSVPNSVNRPMRASGNLRTAPYAAITRLPTPAIVGTIDTSTTSGSSRTRVAIATATVAAHPATTPAIQLSK